MSVPLPSLWRAARPLLGLGAAALLVWFVWEADALDRLAGADVAWLAVAVGLLLAQTILSAIRWRLLARALGLTLTVRRAVGEYLLAQFLNQTLPGGIAGEAARAVRSRADAGLGRAALSVALDRAAGQAGLLVLTAAGVSLALLAPGELSSALDGAAPILGLAAVLVLGTVGGIGLARRWTRAGPALAEAGRAFRPGAPLALQVALSLGTAGLNLAAFAAAGRATGVELGPVATLTLVPLVLSAMLIPAGLAGWGWREGAAAALLPLAGASAAGALAVSIAFGLCVLAAALPGALVLALGPARPSEADAAETAGDPSPAPPAKEVHP